MSDILYTLEPLLYSDLWFLPCLHPNILLERQEPEEPEFNFSTGQRVRIVEGPFTEFVGRVSESHREQKKVTVLISYFGKETPFVFDFLQVEKTEPFLP